MLTVRSQCTGNLTKIVIVFYFSCENIVHAHIISIQSISAVFINAQFTESSPCAGRTKESRVTGADKRWVA